MKKGSPHRPLFLPELKPKRPKYGNKKVLFMGEKFDSIVERDRYIFLLDAQKQGLITNLERQVPYRLEVNGKLICKLVADHRFHVTGHGTITEDVKSPASITRGFRIKAKLFEALYHKPIHIVTKDNLDELP
jgi:hypothetical protein